VGAGGAVRRPAAAAAACYSTLAEAVWYVWACRGVVGRQRMGREPRKCIIVDNSPASYLLQPENAIPISSWFDAPNDQQLLLMLPWLQVALPYARRPPAGSQLPPHAPSPARPPSLLFVALLHSLFA